MSYSIPVNTQRRDGTTLIELDLGSLDDAHIVAGSKPEGFTPLVFSMPKRDCFNYCCCECSCIQRIPTGFYPIVTSFGRLDDTDHQAGTNCMMPWKRVQKLVTRQLTAFESPIRYVKTQDNIRVSLNAIMVFKITDGVHFVVNIGPEKFDLMLRAHMDEAVRRMASAIPISNLYDMQGQDSEEILAEMNEKFAMHELGVEVLSFTVVSVAMPPDLIMAMQAKTGFGSQTKHLEAEQGLKLQGLDNMMELERLQEEARVERLKVEEEGATQLAEIDIEITGILSKSSKACAASKAEYEEKVQELVNDAELEVVDLNNQRDSVTREVKSVLQKEKIEIRADALMYSREKELEKVTKQAENQAQAKKVVANAEAEASEVLAARRSHDQQMARLKVYEALGRNRKLRIATSQEVAGGANLKASSDEVDELVHLGMRWAKTQLSAPLQQSIPASGGRKR